MLWLFTSVKLHVEFLQLIEYALLLSLKALRMFFHTCLISLISLEEILKVSIRALSSFTYFSCFVCMQPMLQISFQGTADAVATDAESNWSGRSQTMGKVRGSQKRSSALSSGWEFCSKLKVS